MRTILALALAFALWACAAPSAREGHALRVAAASSLTDVLTDLADDFERTEAATISLFFAASSTLARQIAAGLDSDVFAAADEEAMTTLERNGVVGSPVVFARNRLTIAVPEDNPARIRSLGDLARPDARIALCAVQVPCGRLTQRVLRSAGVAVPAASQEENVRAVLTKVSLGEADAGIVYVTDARTDAERVDAVAIDPRHNVEARHAVAVVSATPRARLARSFVRALRSRHALRLLRRHGFASP